jgi:hypothetical protein
LKASTASGRTSHDRPFSEAPVKLLHWPNVISSIVDCARLHDDDSKTNPGVGTVVEFRRGIDGSTWQKFWHFNEECSQYPIKGFLIADYPPFHEEVCPQCKSLTRDGGHNS